MFSHADSLAECFSNDECPDCHVCVKNKCVNLCEEGEVCYNGKCCKPDYSSVECGCATSCGITKCFGGCPNKVECDGDSVKYYTGYCKSNKCHYRLQSTTNCNIHDGWYCKNKTSREYRDFTCDNGYCDYTVTSTKECSSSTPFCCSDNQCHECCNTEDCQATYGLNYFCNDDKKCECIPENKDDVGADCGPDGCNPLGFGTCNENQECIENFCVNKKSFRTIIGYLDLKGFNEKELKVELKKYDSSGESSASYYCEKFNQQLFKHENCYGKDYDECGGMPGNDDIVNFNVFNYEWNNQRVELNCNQKGPIDGWCDGLNTDIAKIKLCDPSKGISCDSDYYINISKLGLDIHCVMLDKENENSKTCDASNKLILRAINNYQLCDDKGDVCIMGKCVPYLCHQNSKIDNHEFCDPIIPKKYNIGGNEKTDESISCTDFGFNPKDLDASKKPTCLKTCITSTKNCEEPSSLCGNKKIDSRGDYQEVCELKDPIELKHPNGTVVKITTQFKTKHYCAEKEGYIGDASRLKCKNCIEIDYENCETAALNDEEKQEQNCGDGINEDYWYDLYVPKGQDRKQYIINQYLDEQGYFHNYVFDTNKCYNSTHCHDCYDLDCDNKTTIGNNICNFKHERFCNDNFDNDQDGLADNQDPDCQFLKYNPQLSKTGYCNNNNKCYIENQLECVNNEYYEDFNNFLVICNNGNWTSPIKILSNVLYNRMSNKNEFTIYCNNFGDLNKDKGYVISLSSKLSNYEMTIKDFMNSYSQLFGKFCALKNSNNFAIATRIKNLKDDFNKLQIISPLFSPSPIIYNTYENNDILRLVKNLKKDKIYLNTKYGIIIKSDIELENTHLLNSNTINQKIKELSEYLPYIGVNPQTKELFLQSPLIEALIWKKKNDQEIFGIIETINETTYSIILIKNIKSFSNSCITINSKKTIKISNNLFGKCKKIDNRKFIVYWVVHRNIPYKDELIKNSLEEFDKVIKPIRLT